MLKFIHPSTMIVSGPTGSGKTKLVSRVIIERLIEPPPERIIWIYAEWQPLYEIVQMSHPSIEFIQGVPPNLYGSISPASRNLVILDDQMSEAGDSKELSQLFTKGSHHRNLSVIYIVQNLFDKGRSMRTVSLNSHYLIIFKSPRDKTQIGHLGRQMFPANSKFLIDAFEDATTEPYGYLVLDMRPETPEEFRVRSRIFRNENGVVYTPSGYKRS